MSAGVEVVVLRPYKKNVCRRGLAVDAVASEVDGGTGSTGKVSGAPDDEHPLDGAAMPSTAASGRGPGLTVG